MPDRVVADHPSVHTVRATLVRAGRTTRPRVAIPAAEAVRFPAGEVVRLVVDGRERFTLVAAGRGDDGPQLRGAFGTPDAAHDPAAGTDRLPDWQAAAGVDLGGSVLVDVVEPGYRYGLRAPGERATYDAGRPPDGLRDIARDLLGESADDGDPSSGG